MNTRKAVTVCNFYIFAESELFMFTKRNRIRHGFEGIINRNDHVYQYRILNNADRDRIELELTLPIICQKNQMSTMLGYLIEVNLIYKDRGIFSINEEGAIKIKREIPCKYFSPTIETIEYAFWGLLTSANDFYDVIEAISKDNSIPDHEEVSSRIYYDVYQKKAKYNQVANFTYLDTPTNIAVDKDEPCKYFTNINMYTISYLLILLYYCQVLII